MVSKHRKWGNWNPEYKKKINEIRAQSPFSVKGEAWLRLLCQGKRADRLFPLGLGRGKTTLPTLLGVPGLALGTLCKGITEHWYRFHWKHTGFPHAAGSASQGKRVHGEGTPEAPQPLWQILGVCEGGVGLREVKGSEGHSGREKGACSRQRESIRQGLEV